MLKNQTILEIKRDERVYQFTCDPTTPLGELHDVLLEMKDFVISKINEIQKAEKSLVPKEEPKIEEQAA